MLFKANTFICPKGENLYANQRIILADIANWIQEDRWNRKKNYFKSIKTIAFEILRNNSIRSVQCAMKRLEKLGWIVIVHGVRDGNRNASNEYRAGPKLLELFESLKPKLNHSNDNKKKHLSDYQKEHNKEYWRKINARNDAAELKEIILKTSRNKSQEFIIDAFKLFQNFQKDVKRKIID